MTNPFWGLIKLMLILCGAFFCMGLVVILLTVIAKAVGAA